MNSMNKDYSFDTLAVRAGQQRSQFNEHSEALYLTSSFVSTARRKPQHVFRERNPATCTPASPTRP